MGSIALPLLPEAWCGRWPLLLLAAGSCLLPIEEGREPKTGGAELGGEGWLFTRTSPPNRMPSSKSWGKGKQVGERADWHC